MILEFKIENFRSFYQETVLSMIASSQRDHPEFFNRELFPKRRILPSAVIYGPNASGKTSLMLALATLREMVLEGHIRNEDQNSLLRKLELDAFIHEYEKFNEPIKWEITYIHEQKEFTYGIEVQASVPHKEEAGKRKVVYEYLTINETSIFERSDNIIKLNSTPKALKHYRKKINSNLLKTLENQIQSNLDQKELFLTNAFRNVVDNKLAQKVIQWFQNNLILLIDFDERDLYIKTPDDFPKGKIAIQNEIMQALLKHADFGPQKMAYVIEHEEENVHRKATLRSRYQINGWDQHKGIEIPSELVESKGTLKIMKFAIPFIEALLNGYTLIIDEMDSSMHPDLVVAIISVFNNPEFNQKGAQLIFNTHNPIYLNKNIYRRDQIIFVEKNPDTLESEMYSLADFKTSGKHRVRNDASYLRNYMDGKYGALPFADFSDSIAKALEILRAREASNG